MISNCIFTWAITRTTAEHTVTFALWIDFKLYFYVSNHKSAPIAKDIGAVVNWFQIVFLREQSQEPFLPLKTYRCCELISNCIFTWAITRLYSRQIYLVKLWIDFKLYFYVSNHKYFCCILYHLQVVNWFQIVFLREQSQVNKFHFCSRSSCELISNCIFTWAITSNLSELSNMVLLWIDFKLYFYVSNHKMRLMQ